MVLPNCANECGDSPPISHSLPCDKHATPTTPLHVPTIPYVQALHDGFLETGVPGWGSASQYASVANSQPEKIVNFLSQKVRYLPAAV